MEYLIPTANHWACDIEADGLLDEVTTLWCVTVENVLTGEKHAFVEASAFRDFLSSNSNVLLVGHNFIAYDAVVLNRFWGTRIPMSRICDTFVMSQLYNPGMKRPQGLKGQKGPHSLEAWGIRLNRNKTGHDDFSKFTPEMLAYCANDTGLTALLFRKLAERMRQTGFTEEGCEIEHLAWHIIQNKQKRNGFPFDKRKATELYVTLRGKEEELRREIHELWPPNLQVVGEYKSGYKKNGSPSAQFIRHSEQFPKLASNPDGSYCVYDYVAFNLGSPTQRVEKLLELGWKPVEKTKAGNPKIDEDALLAFAEESGQKEVKALAKWIVINSRANMVNTWLNSYDEKTGCIHGKLFIAGTLRYRHSGPNSANIPAVRSQKDEHGVDRILFGDAGAWTYECRDLWTAGGDEFVLVGIDGTGIQNRCLIHNLIKTVGAERVEPFKQLGLSGDVHKHNIEVLGLANKAAAKKFYYTLMMGGGGARLAGDQAQFGTKMTPKEGEAKRKMMIESIPGFGELIDELQAELERTGRIKLCDGTPILVPSPHMVIPYLLQGDESRIMKKTSIIIDSRIRRNKWQSDVFKVADIHDEMQFKVRKELADEFISVALPCFLEAGEYFNYNIEIEGDAKKGLTWAQTH
jgi:DNA polymerase-1